VLGACTLVVVAVVFTVTRQLDDTETIPSASEPETEIEVPPLQAIEAKPEEAVVVLAPGVGQELIEDFVARQDWRAMNLLEFQDSWTRLPEADRIVAKGAIWFEPMSDSLAYQIDEAREFAADPENDEQLDRLYEFSLHLGLVELVPSGWMPDPENINRGAESLAAADSADEPVDDTALAALNAAGTQAGAQPASSSEAATGTTAGAVAENKNACKAAQLETRRRNCFDLFPNGENGPVMRVLPGGEFVMGSDKNAEEQPVRSVVVAKPFAISVFEVKAADFRLYCKAAGSRCPAEPWPDDDMPVVDVSWHEAVAYSEWLTAQTGQSYRLPTEEEWEYAVRAGTTTEYPFGDKLLPAQARFSSISNYESPLPSSDRTTQKNEFGLWHVIGNVREWVGTDWSSLANAEGGADLKVVRGGSYASSDDELRSSARQGMAANDKDSRTGFRLLREL
jgi:formylglycine-generating enzyme required for sulfatase activity